MLKKDLDVLLSTAKAQQTLLPLNGMIRDIYAAAAKQGLGEKDFFVLVHEAEKTASE